ncbi:FAD-binding oxidoreductase [Novosphingobium sp. RL4]|uniref:NAD(P)/FAD-dependent oxidoreductase n=1 Tax=Novosphingobium sp. RL4 TaxID=3109595 RepID=UPI002D78B967|nr:FAD-binding oxidoreductase [Novosphingobium sp. RL4]WRT96062.1 FAD-binding oxidoreductase [Novosphingobium sp. RL4]
MQIKPYWTDTRTPFSSAREGRVPARASVVVVGGGFTGLSAARTLAMRGIDTVLVEAGEVAAAASGRNGGHCNNGTASDLAGLAASLGLEEAKRLYGLYDSAVDFVEETVRGEAIDCDFVRNGKIKLAAKPSHVDGLKRAGEFLARHVEPDLVFLDRAALQGEVRSDAFHAGIVMPRGAQMHMGRFGVGLAEAAARHGAAIFENAPATGIERLAGGRHRVTTPKGNVTADAVFLATGPSLQGPFRWIRRRTIPMGSFIVATEPLSETQVAATMTGRRNCVTSKNIGNYFRLTADNRLIFGGRARFALSDPASDAKSGAILRRALAKIFPALAEIGIDYTWGGVLDMTPDRLPRAGVHDGLHYAVGLSGHGAQFSGFIGDRMARLIAGEADANPLDGKAFKPIPGHIGPPWFLPFVGAWYRFLDWRS